MKPLTELLALPDLSNFHLDQMKLYQQSESRLVADSGSTLLWILRSDLSYTVPLWDKDEAGAIAMGVKLS